MEALPVLRHEAIAHVSGMQSLVNFTREPYLHEQHARTCNKGSLVLVPLNCE